MSDVVQSTTPEDYPRIDCLDHGFVRLIDSMGNDARIVQAARVSYQKGTKAVQSDRHLIRYLLRNLHTTPLEKVRFEFHVKLPMFVARQWMRHRMGSFNEVSARYSVMPDVFYTPDELRKQSKTNRQGSSSEVITDFPVWEPGLDDDQLDRIPVQEYIGGICNELYHTNYEGLLEEGVAREQARMVLPVNIYTEFYWTVDLWNLMHFLKLRIDAHAQKEIRVYGQAIVKLIEDNCDLQYAMEAFQDYIVDAPNLSVFEIQVIKKAISVLDPVSRKLFVENLVAGLDGHDKMSKREKKESRLIELLLGAENERDDQENSL